MSAEREVAELEAAQERVSAVLRPVLMDPLLVPQAVMVAAVDVIATLIGGCRRAGGISDDDVRDLIERFDVRISQARGSR